LTDQPTLLKPPTVRMFGSGMSISKKVALVADEAGSSTPVIVVV